MHELREEVEHVVFPHQAANLDQAHIQVVVLQLRDVFAWEELLFNQRLQISLDSWYLGDN